LSKSLFQEGALGKRVADSTYESIVWREAEGQQLLVEMSMIE
jgi:hypothetical protein